MNRLHDHMLCARGMLERVLERVLRRIWRGRNGDSVAFLTCVDRWSYGAEGTWMGRTLGSLGGWRWAAERRGQGSGWGLGSGAVDLLARFRALFSD